MTAILEISGLIKDFRGLRPLRIQRLSIGVAEQVAIVGIDQSGAETFVNLITGASLPDQGEIRVFGNATTSVDTSTAWLALVDRFGLLTHRAVLLEPLTVATKWMPANRGGKPSHVAKAHRAREKGARLSPGRVEAVDQSEDLIYQVSQRRVSSEFVPLKDLLTENMEMIEKLYEQGSPITGLPSGFRDLDELTAGLQPSNLIIVAARPAMGKSSFAVTTSRTSLLPGSPMVMSAPSRSVSALRATPSRLSSLKCPSASVRGAANRRLCPTGNGASAYAANGGALTTISSTYQPSICTFAFAWKRKRNRTVWPARAAGNTSFFLPGDWSSGWST